LVHTGTLALCESGLHASLEPFDALRFAPGPTVCLVECDGQILHGSDKLVCERRRIIARMDATELLRYFARMQAVSCLHLWMTEPPDVVLDYLMTGDESLRLAAQSAAWLAREAAQSAAWLAAQSAAWLAAQSATRSASESAAADAALAAAADAAWSAEAAARQEFNALVYECFEGVR
jgi:hypothetical protein